MPRVFVTASKKHSVSVYDSGYKARQQLEDFKSLKFSLTSQHTGTRLELKQNKTLGNLKLGLSSDIKYIYV